MADDPKPNEGAAPAFDAGAFLNDVESRVGALLEQKLPKPAAITYPYGNARPAPKPAATDDDPMATLVTPYVERAVKPLQDEVAQANLRTQMAEDRAVFLASHPGMDPKLVQRVEEAAQRLKDAGSPFIREDIYKWIRGEEALKEDAARAERDKVAAAATVGGHGVPLGAGMGERDYYSMSDDELALASKGKVF